MTKLRAPCTFEQALARITGLLEHDNAAKLIGKSSRTLYDYMDSDVATSISLEDAWTLDNAFAEAGGDGYPLHQCYALRLDTEAAVSRQDGEAHARLLADATREAGEAIAAQIVATQPGATPADRLIAIRETEQAVSSLTNTLPMLDREGPSTARVTPRGGAST